MNRATLMSALGAGETADPSAEIEETAGELPDEEPDSGVDENVTAFFDDSLPMPDRIEAFRAAVSACMKGY